MHKDSKIYIAGHRGLVGSAIVRALEKEGYSNLIFRTRHEMDLLDTLNIKNFFEQEKPEYVFMAAGKVGGIMANNTYPADFIYENIVMTSNIIHHSYLNGVKKLLFLGSVCIYPKHCPVPVKEEYLMTGSLEPTNEPYAIAKIAGVKKCQSYNRQYGTNFISNMPANLYGPNDNFDLENSHVLPALIRKFHEAKTSDLKSVTLWGTGEPRREFLYVDDVADGCVFMMDNFDPTKEQNEKGEMFLNLGAGYDISIIELASTVKDIVGYDGKIAWDTSKPDGTPKRLLDSTKIKELGWKPKTDLQTGIELTYKWFVDSYKVK
jgi:GDP-L-fucose synthase